MKLMLAGILMLLLMACNAPGSKKQKNVFVFKETIATGDTGMIIFGRQKPLNITYDLCQQWQLADPDDANTVDLTYDPMTGDHLFQEIMLYRDSSVMFNPRNGMKMGKWRLGQQDDKLILLFNFADGTRKRYIVLQKRSNQLALAWKEGESRFGMRLTSDARMHANMLNDPFHPSNNQWRIHPAKSESDKQIAERIKNCIRFYALFFRDQIKRQKNEINFSGLPSCFIWYRRGIGLNKDDELSKTWRNCFYSSQQALKGKGLIKNLFDKYDFDWPRGTPNWMYETQSVLEQMYHKM